MQIYVAIIAVLHFITLNVITINANNVAYQGMQPTCPPNFVLLNGLCYQQNQLPTQNCPVGYYLSNNLCYRINPIPCDGSTTETVPIITTTSLPEPETTTEAVPETTEAIPEATEEAIIETTPEPDSIIICPIGSTLSEDGICRKVYCTQGEYYQGRCLQPICPEGTVWRSNSCQLPSYSTIILEIENVIHNELNERPGHVVNDNKNNIYYHNSTTAPSTNVIETTTSKIWPTQRPPMKPKPTVATKPSNNGTNPQECCSIVTPRICKRYDAKWVCFNRRYRRCDPVVCQNPIVYLKTPKIVYEPPVLIMPPNPPLQACVTPGCDVGDTVDCSGCAHNIRETCSTYCYRYMCPSNACAFIEQQKYCSLYPGEPGCTKQDGCLWNWCGEKC